MSLERLKFMLKWAIFGGIAGGLIALAGYFILSPQTDSVVLFVLLRVLLGAVVAALLAPLLARASSSTR